jgi:hypothetical protein
VAATGENQWPPPGSPVTVYGEDLMAADSSRRRLRDCRRVAPVGRWEGSQSSWLIGQIANPRMEAA